MYMYMYMYIYIYIYTYNSPLFSHVGKLSACKCRAAAPGIRGGGGYC